MLLRYILLCKERTANTLHYTINVFRDNIIIIYQTILGKSATASKFFVQDNIGPSINAYKLKLMSNFKQLCEVPFYRRIGLLLYGKTLKIVVIIWRGDPITTTNNNSHVCQILLYWSICYGCKQLLNIIGTLLLTM